MSKHSPGPWRWRNFTGHWTLFADHGSRKVVLAADLNYVDGPVLVTRDFEDGSILKEIDPNHPNAKLIEAAPDLFDSLRECVVHCCRVGLDRPENSGWLDKARSILARASG